MKAWRAKDLLKQTFPDPLWLAKGLIPGSGMVLVTALPKTGKTVLCLQLADALARGQSFLGMRVTQPWRVTFVGNDAPLVDYRVQIAAISADPGFDFIYAESPICLTLATAEVHHVYRQLRDYAPDLVIYDSLESLSELDLNTLAGCKVALHNLRYLAQGKPIVIIHHPHKPRGDGSQVEDPRTTPAGHHYLMGQASVYVDLWGDNTRGVLTTGARRAQQRQVKLRRNPISDEVALWVLA